MYNSDYNQGYKEFLRRNDLPEGTDRARFVDMNPLGAVLPIGLYGAYRAMADRMPRVEASPMFDATDDYLDIERERAMQEAIARRQMMYGNTDGLYR